MRLLLVGDLASPHLRRWADGLHEAGHQVMGVGFGALGDASPVPFHSLGGEELSQSRYPRSLPALRMDVARFRPDVVHAHFVSSYGLMAAAVAGRRPVIQFAWGSDVLQLSTKHRFQQRLVRSALRRAQAVVFDSLDVGAGVAALAPGVRREIVTFGPERSWTEAERHPAPVVLSTRMLRPPYNVEDIIDAFDLVAGEHPDWVLEVMTSGADPAAFRERQAAQALGDRIHWLPRLDRTAVLDRFLSVEVFCSVPFTDATAASLLEAMATGCFPVLSDLPANRDWVEDGVNGLIVPVGDVARLAEALGQALDDADLRARAADANRPKVAATATWDRAVEKVAALSAEVAKG